MICNSILDTIGHTPLVKLNKLLSPKSAQVLMKIESFNPGGSVKDRIALSMIEDAEKRGVLKKGMTIVEPTSGNTGIGLAIVAAVKGYPIVFTMPESMSVERRIVLEQFGAKLVLTQKEKGMVGAVLEAEALSDGDNYYMPHQFENEANPESHRKTTAEEIMSDLQNITPDFLVVGVGTGGTITGVGEVFKEKYPNIKIIAVEPADSPILSEGTAGPHMIQGIGAGFIPDILDLDIIDDIIKVENEDAISTAKKLCSHEGILAGISSGANVWAAMEVAKNTGEGKTVITFLPDTGERYLSTALFE